MEALSLVKDFTIQLGNTEISESIKLHLAHATSIFSLDNQNRPKTNEEIAKRKSSYGGKGHDIINATADTISISSKTSPPPPYLLNKRKRKRKHSTSEYDDVASNSRKDLEARVVYLEARLNGTEARVTELEAVREEYGEVVANEVSKLLGDFTHSDTLEHMVKHHVKDFMDYLKTNMDDIFEEKKEHFKESIQGLKQEVKEECKKLFLKEFKRNMANIIDTRLKFSFIKKEQ